MYNEIVAMLEANNNQKAADLAFVLDTEGMDWDNYSTVAMFTLLREMELDLNELTLFNAATAVDTAVAVLRSGK